MYHFAKNGEYGAITITFHAQSSDLQHKNCIWGMTTALLWLHWMCLVKPIGEQPNTVIRWIRHKLFHHLVSFLRVTQITRLKKSSKGVIYEESLHRRSASTCWWDQISMMSARSVPAGLSSMQGGARNSTPWRKREGELWSVFCKFTM